MYMLKACSLVLVSTPTCVSQQERLHSRDCGQHQSSQIPRTTYVGIKSIHKRYSVRNFYKLSLYVWNLTRLASRLNLAVACFTSFTIG